MSDLPEKDNNLNENTENISNEEDGASTVFSDPADHKKTAVKKKRSLLPIIISETIKVLDKSSDDFKIVTVTNKNGTFKLYSEEEKVESSSSSSDTSSSSTKTVCVS